MRTCQLSYDWPDMAGKCHGYGSEMDFTYKIEVIDTVQHQYVTCLKYSDIIAVELCLGCDRISNHNLFEQLVESASDHI